MPGFQPSALFFVLPGPYSLILTQIFINFWELTYFSNALRANYYYIILTHGGTSSTPWATA